MIIDTEFNSAAQVPSRICVDAAVLAEERGFGCVWKGESNSRDPMVFMSAMAARTSTLDVGSAIYHVFGRTPVSLAIQAATLNEFAQGRMILGLGVANPIIAAWHGESFERPLGRLREYLEVFHAAYSGERVDYKGDFYSVDGFRLAFEPPGYPLRVWIAGLGPQMCRLAGKLSDGLIVNMANPPMIEGMVHTFHEGAQEAGKNPADLTVVSKVRVSLNEDVEKAKWALKKVLTFYCLAGGYSDMLRKMGWDSVVDTVRATYDSDGFHTARKQVPDEMIDDVPMYAGADLDGLPEKLAGYEAAGSQRCVAAYVPSGEDLWGEIQRYLKMADFAREMAGTAGPASTAGTAGAAG